MNKIKKFGFSVNYGYNKFIQPASESFSTRKNFMSSSNHITESEGTNKYSGGMNFLRGEASYEIDTLNLISLSFMGHFGNYSSTGNNLTSDFNTEDILTRQFENIMRTANDYGSLSGNIDYQHTFNKPDKTFTSTSTNYMHYRMFRIYVSYQFGQMEEQIKKAKRSISNDDLKSGGNSGQGGGAVTPAR